MSGDLKEDTAPLQGQNTLTADDIARLRQIVLDGLAQLHLAMNGLLKTCDAASANCKAAAARHEVWMASSLAESKTQALRDEETERRCQRTAERYDRLIALDDHNRALLKRFPNGPYPSPRSSHPAQGVSPEVGFAIGFVIGCGLGGGGGSSDGGDCSGS